MSGRDLNPSVLRNTGSHPDNELARRKRSWGIVALAALAIILIPPLAGMSGTAITLVQSFADVPSENAVHVEMSAGDLSSSLRLTMFGLVGSMMGVAFLVLAMVRRAQLEKQIRAKAVMS